MATALFGSLSSPGRSRWLVRAANSAAGPAVQSGETEKLPAPAPAAHRTTANPCFVVSRAGRQGMAGVAGQCSSLLGKELSEAQFLQQEAVVSLTHPVVAAAAGVSPIFDDHLFGERLFCSYICGYNISPEGRQRGPCREAAPACPPLLPRPAAGVTAAAAGGAGAALRCLPGGLQSSALQTAQHQHSSRG